MTQGESSLPAAILSILATAEEPLPLREIADAASSNTIEVSKRLSYLVTNRDVHRHHSPNGLTYSITEQGMRKTAKRQHGSLMERVSEVLKAAPRPLSVADVDAAINDRSIPRQNLSATLSALLKRGRAARHGDRCNSTWSHVDPVSPPAPSSAHEAAPTGPAPVATESPAPPGTPDTTTPHVVHSATPEIPNLPAAHAKPAGQLAAEIEKAAVRAARSEPSSTRAAAALLRAVADLIDPPSTTGDPS